MRSSIGENGNHALSKSMESLFFEQSHGRMQHNEILGHRLLP